MNIFYLNFNPVIAAQEQCDKHIVKMVTESAQMLSTAHRLLDGSPIKIPSLSGKRLRNVYVHPDPILETVFYKNVHEKHPCTVWTMESSANYFWHVIHFLALADEYTYRYGKIHACDTRFRDVFNKAPINISQGDMTPMRLAMAGNPECIALGDPILAYQAFYQTKQERFKMTWKNREIPKWFQVKDFG